MDRDEFVKRFLAARGAAIAAEFAHLNETQREAVLATQGPLLLLAGAGSGKTTVLINRIANLLKYGAGSDSVNMPDHVTEDDLAFLESYAGAQISATGAERRGGDSEANPGSGSLSDKTRALELCRLDPVEPWRIIAITFTNKAAGEMKERLERMLGPGADDIWASTFHSACVRILRREIDRLGYDTSFAIYDTADSASLMKRIMKELDVDERSFPHKTVLTYISRAKDAMLSAADFNASAEAGGDLRRKIVGCAYVEYEKRMRASNSLDFDDLILLTVRLFQQCPDVLERYQKRFRHVLIDEYQDTNNLQYLLASALAGGHGNICVVGDDDQSIYKFRGATIENILNFEKHFKDARVIRLEQNYRSTGHILDAANDVICNNRGRKGKKLWTERGPGEKPSLHLVTDERDEAQFVADTISESASEGRAWREHAILYRMNAQSNQFETAFKRAGIPYRIFGGTGFYERAEIKDMLAYMCIVHNPSDDVRLLRVINDPPRGIGNTTVSRMVEIAASESRPVFAIVDESHKYSALKSGAGRLRQFADMISDLRELSLKAPLDELYDELIERTGYIKMLEEKGSDENFARIENVRELKTNIISFMEENGGSLFDFLSETALFTDLDRDESSLDRVMMMTMHSAKGLEFDTVFIVGAEEGIFPGIRAIGEPGEIEEERRLCYVAMTRAMRRLYLTCTRRRMLFGKTSASPPSRFVGEISSENIEVHESAMKFEGFDIDYTGGFGYYGGGISRSGAGVTPYGGGDTRAAGRDARAGGNASTHGGGDVLATGSRPYGESSTIYEKGDTIVHKVFGRGVIVASSPAGGDALLEIAFDEAGTKRMLKKSAARYMVKAEEV